MIIPFRSLFLALALVLALPPKALWAFGNRPDFDAEACKSALSALRREPVADRLAQIGAIPPTEVIFANTPAYKHPELATTQGNIAIAQLNAEDFTVDDQQVHVFLARENAEHVEDLPAKDPQKIKEIAQAILSHQAGIIVMHEVLGEHREDVVANLDKFSDQYLNGEYMTLALEANDGWGKKTVIMVRKDLPFKIEYRSYRKARIPNDIPPYFANKKVFSRDMVVALFYVEGREAPVLIVAGNHNKSQRVSPNDKRPDAAGFTLRLIQSDYAAAIHTDIERQYPGVPFFDAGDRNSDYDADSGFEALKSVSTNLFDRFHFPPERRLTNPYFDDAGQLHWAADDNIVVNRAALRPGLIRSVETGPYLDDDGNPIGPTQDAKDPSPMPSDHFPVWAQVDLGNLLGQ